MSPRQQDSYSLKVRPLTVKRSRLEKRQIQVKDTRDSKIPHLNQEGDWLGKKTRVKPNSNVWGIKCDEDLLNLYGASECPVETLRKSPVPYSTLIPSFSNRKVPKKSPQLQSLISLLSDSPTLGVSQCEVDTMRGRNTRVSTDSSEAALAMPSGSGSSRITSPIGRRDQKEGDMASPVTPRSGKRKRQKSHDIGTPKSRNKAAKASVVDSDAEIIEVDDTETPPAKPARALRSATVLTDHTKVCEFPVGTKDSVSVCLADYKTLQHDTFLNDIIIDFYLTYLYHVFLNKEDMPTVHIFSTMFYKRLNSTPKKASTVASYEKDSSLKPAEKRHMRVKGWTKNVNLFEKNMVIIPICEHSHWYLIIAIRPGLIKIPVGSEERQTKGEPFMIVLDSMGGNKTAAVANIRHYLAAEWKAKMWGDEGDEDEYEFSSKEMKTVRPKKPEQENYSDCGIYLLHYIEMMFKSVAQYYWPSSILDLGTWFTIEEISTKRDEIARLIRRLTEDQNLDKEMKFPDIPFLPTIPVTRSKRRDRDYDPSSESEEDDWGKGHVLGGGSGGIAATGFYGERSGIKKNLRSGESSSVTGTSGDSDVGSLTASEVAREARHKSREQRSKEKVDSSSKLVKVKTRDNDNSSRLALVSKLQQIQGARSTFDEMKDYKVPKSVKQSACDSDKLDPKRRTGRTSSGGESVIVVTDISNSTSSQQKHFTTNIVPNRRSPKKPDDQSKSSSNSKTVRIPSGTTVNNGIDLATSSGSARNSIVNPKQVKSRADLHKEWNCVADLHKIEAEMEEEEDKLEEDKAVKRRQKGAAFKAFREDQKAIHESIVNEASRLTSSNACGKSELLINNQFSKSLPVLSRRKVKSTPEKSKVLQSKVLEDLLELEEEGNTEDEEEEMNEQVKALEIEDKPEPVHEIKKVKASRNKEPFRNIVNEKVKIKGGKELFKVTPEPERKDTTEQVEYIESPMNSPEISTVEDTPEIRTVEDTPEITTVDDSSEVTTIDDIPPEVIVSIEDDDFPLIGFLEKVPNNSQLKKNSNSIISNQVVKKKPRKPTSEFDSVLIRKSTSEPDSPTFKVSSKSTSEPESSVFRKTGRQKSTSEPESPNCKKTKITKSTSEPESPIFKKTKSTSEPHSPQQEVVCAKPDQSKKMIQIYEVPESRLKSTSEPKELSPEPVIILSKSTSEPHSPILLKSKSTSEPDDYIVLKKQKNKYVAKIQIDSDSDDEENSSGSVCHQPKGVDTAKVCRVSSRPRRERKFSSLSEIERAKLKNIPTAERKKILAEYEKKQKKEKPQERNQQLSKENPFYIRSPRESPRGAKSLQQQRGSKSRASETSSVDEGNFHTGSLGQDSVQIDYNSYTMNATTSKKKFRLNANQGKLSPHNADEGRRGRGGNPASENGSDFTDIYTTEDL